mmetsp:Transcript_19909/g.39925  ORF Transcript_19909/g.39925 Transcript_19909/m.39925 type:complete len:84 (-) Transcript_19909:276-527(-)
MLAIVLGVLAIMAHEGQPKQREKEKEKESKRHPGACPILPNNLGARPLVAVRTSHRHSLGSQIFSHPNRRHLRSNRTGNGGSD